MCSLSAGPVRLSRVAPSSLSAFRIFVSCLFVSFVCLCCLSRPPSAPHPRLYDHLPFWRSNLAACSVVMEGLGDLDPRRASVLSADFLLETDRQTC